MNEQRIAGHRASAAIAAVIDIEGRTRCSTLRCEPPLTFRSTPSGLMWVGTTAGPVGGDELELSISVGDRARLDVASVAAALILPGPTGATSSFTTSVDIGAKASLVWRPEPAVIAARARHRANTVLRWDRGADVVWVDELVLGRHAETAGTVESRTVADGPNGPVLRTGFDTSRPGWDGPAGTAGARVVAQVLLAGAPAARVAAAPAQGPTVATMGLPHGGVLVSAVSDSSLESRRVIDRVVATAIGTTTATATATATTTGETGGSVGSERLAR